MIRSLLIVVCCSVAAVHGADGNGFNKAKVGDWIKYRCISTSKGGLVDDKLQYEVRYTVTEISENIATVECVKRIKEEGKPLVLYVDLTSGDQITIKRDDDEGIVGSTEITDSGTEVLTFKGKDIKCKWTKTESKPFPGVRKEWKSSEIPLFRLMRREEVVTFEPMKTTTITELIDFGSK